MLKGFKIFISQTFYWQNIYLHTEKNNVLHSHPIPKYDKMDADSLACNATQHGTSMKWTISLHCTVQIIHVKKNKNSTTNVDCQNVSHIAILTPLTMDLTNVCNVQMFKCHFLADCRRAVKMRVHGIPSLSSAKLTKVTPTLCLQNIILFKVEFGIWSLVCPSPRHALF